MEKVGNTPTKAPTGGGIVPDAPKTGAAVVERPLKAMHLIGKKAVEMLNAVLTNEVPEKENVGVYALLLDPKGRVQADLRVLKGSGSIVVVTEPEGYAAARDILGRYAPFSRVKLEELPEWAVLGLYGPESRGLLGVALAEHEPAEVEVGGARLLAVGVETSVPGYDLLGPAEAVKKAREHLVGAGAFPADSFFYETARIEAGVPRFGSDVGTTNFPGEAGLLDRAVSFKKGCYPGQETVARMHYRGSPNKKLCHFKLQDPVPEPGTEVIQGEKPVGKLTSIAPLQTGGNRLALGYLARGTDLDGPLRAGEAEIKVLGEVS